MAKTLLWETQKVGVIFHHQPENELTLIVMGLVMQMDPFPFFSLTGCPQSNLHLKGNKSNTSLPVSQRTGTEKGSQVSAHTWTLAQPECCCSVSFSVGEKSVCVSAETQEINQRLNSRPQFGSRRPIPLLNSKKQLHNWRPESQ